MKAHLGPTMVDLEEGIFSPRSLPKAYMKDNKNGAARIAKMLGGVREKLKERPVEASIELDLDLADLIRRQKEEP